MVLIAPDAEWSPSSSVETTEQDTCGEEETGHRAAKGGGAHLAYNGDGYYVKAAACYIAKKFKEAGGSVDAPAGSR
jgi:hypothetical protein